MYICKYIYYMIDILYIYYRYTIYIYIYTYIYIYIYIYFFFSKYSQEKTAICDN